jgi:hypothetical protein
LKDALARVLDEIRLRYRTEDLKIAMQAFRFLRRVLLGMLMTPGHVA